MANDSQDNNIGLVVSLIKQEQQRHPIKVSSLLTSDQRFELRCLRDHLQHERQNEVTQRSKDGRYPPPATDHERNCDHWIETLDQLLA